jgi:hypothetical protein
MYVYIANTETVTYYIPDPSFRQGGHLMTNKTVLTRAKSPSHEYQSGSTPRRTDGRTDWPSVLK